MKLGVYLGWHVHPWEDLLALVRRAESLGYAAAFVDGDISMLETRREADCLDGWTVTSALLGATQRIEIGSMRLAHHWNAARLAQATATAERIAPGRLRFLISAGDWPIDARFGLPALSARERMGWLDETLEAVRALWRGETVTRDGRFVKLRDARVRPIPPGGRIEIAVAARRPLMLGVVAAHADVWEVNLPPLPAQVAQAAETLASACEARGRDPAEIRRSMLLFARPGDDPAVARDAFRRLNPWFDKLSEAERGEALILGDAPACREQIARLAAELALELPVIDASGLPAGPTHELLEALAPDDLPR